jgi:hypothetical protein
MKLRYETGTATLVQFAVVVILALANGGVSIISTCVKNGGDCVSNSLVSLLVIILQAFWLGFISVVGYGAQDRRSKRLAQLLIGFEGINAIIALFNARHFANILGLITSLIDLSIAAWIIFLAWNLIRADGGRIVKPTTGSRSRRRPTPPVQT